ncbi:MAG: hypothetical protein ACM3RX_09245 [Methanococcaceae archaeon]
MNHPNESETMHESQNIINAEDHAAQLPFSISSEFTRLKTIQYMLKTNSEIISTFPEFANTIDKLNEITTRIFCMYSNIKEKLINLIIKITNGLRSYGVMTDNEEIISASSVKSTTLNSLNDTELLKRGDLILDCTHRYFSSLCYFGVQIQTLLDFEKNKEIFSYIIGSSGTYIFENTPWKQEIDSIYADANKLIKGNIDIIMEHIKAEHPNLYLEYITAKLA